MLTFFRLMAQVVLLQRGPDALPRSLSLCLFSIVVVMLESVFFDLMTGRAADVAMIRLILNLAVFSVLLVILLNIAGVGERFLQTLTASAGASAVLSLVYLPVAMLIRAGLSIETFFMVFLATGLWMLIVDGFILSRALGMPRLAGIGIALLFTVAQFTMTRMAGLSA